MSVPTPSKLFRFTSFNPYLLDSVINASVFYNDPTQFNDPFDCNIETEDDDLEIEKLKELRAALRSESETDDHDYYLDSYDIWEMVEDLENPEDRGDERGNLLNAIDHHLRRKLSGFGVVCLSEQVTASLMWAHYAEKHHGICLEYDLQGFESIVGWQFDLRRIDYNRSNRVAMTALYSAYVTRTEANLKEIKNAFFFTKSAAWNYEKEWRVIKPGSGSGMQPGILTGVYFGMRCAPAVRRTLIKLLGGGVHAPAFYRMRGPRPGEQLESSSLFPEPIAQEKIKRERQIEIPSAARQRFAQDVHNIRNIYEAEGS